MTEKDQSGLSHSSLRASVHSDHVLRRALKLMCSGLNAWGESRPFLSSLKCHQQRNSFQRPGECSVVKNTHCSFQGLVFGFQSGFEHPLQEAHTALVSSSKRSELSCLLRHPCSYAHACTQMNMCVHNLKICKTRLYWNMRTVKKKQIKKENSFDLINISKP